MRLGCAMLSMALAACLDAPPSNAIDGSDDPDGGGPGDSDLALNGLAARDALSLDGRDELVLLGQWAGSPVAVILSPTGPRLEDVTISRVDLAFDPIDIILTQWGSLTGLAVIVSDNGALAAIDDNGTLIDLRVQEEDETIRPARMVADINHGGRRLLLGDGEDLYTSDPIAAGVPGEAPLLVVRLGDSTDAVDIAGESAGGVEAAVGVIELDGSVHVHNFQDGDEPTIGIDLTPETAAPGPLLRPTWRIVNSQMILVGIDPAGPRLWYLMVAIDGEVAVGTGSALEGAFDVIHDMVLTRLDETVAELTLLVEVGGELRVVTYLDPEETPDALPPPVVFPVEGLSAPTWMQAMDAVLDTGALGQNEIIVYDRTGKAICVDLVDSELVSCGTIDLAAAVSDGS